MPGRYSPGLLTASLATRTIKVAGKRPGTLPRELVSDVVTRRLTPAPSFGILRKKAFPNFSQLNTDILRCREFGSSQP